MIAHHSAGSHEDILSGFRGALTPLELSETQALAMSGPSYPDLSDISRVTSLDQMTERAQSGELINMIEEGRLTSYFQPIVDARNPGRIHGHEALLRGISPDGKQMIPPEPMFQQAKRSGFISNLDLIARRSAISQAMNVDLQSKLFSFGHI